MSGGGALRAAWEAAQTQTPAKVSASADDPLRVAWEKAQTAVPEANPNQGMSDLLTERGMLPGTERDRQTRLQGETWSQPERGEPTASTTTKVLGTVAAMGRDIPGVEVLQAGTRALVRGQPYGQAFNEIRGAEDAAPAAARIPARMAGGVLAALTMRKIPGIKQGGAMRTGAQYGIAKGLTSADPTLDASSRVHDAAKEGAIGGTVGKIGELGGNLFRALKSETVGATGKLLKGAIKKADKKNFGAAEAEAAAGGGTSPDVQTALNHPLVKSLADDVRQSFTLQGKPLDDAAVLMQVRRELSQNQRALIDRTANASSARPMTAREIDDVGAVKEMLTKAMSDGPAPLAPSFRPAVKVSRELRGERRAFDDVVKVARRTAKGNPTPIKKLDTESPESVTDIVRKMSPGKAKAAARGATGVAKESIGLSGNPFTGFGALGSAARVNRLAPLIEQLDEQSGNNLPAIFRALGITGTTGQFDR